MKSIRKFLCLSMTFILFNGMNLTAMVPYNYGWSYPVPIKKFVEIQKIKNLFSKAPSLNKVKTSFEKIDYLNVCIDIIKLFSNEQIINTSSLFFQAVVDILPKNGQHLKIDINKLIEISRYYATIITQVNRIYNIKIEEIKHCTPNTVEYILQDQVIKMYIQAKQSYDEQQERINKINLKFPAKECYNIYLETLNILIGKFISEIKLPSWEYIKKCVN